MAGNLESTIRAMLRPAVIQAAVDMLHDPLPGVVAAFDAAVPIVLDELVAGLSDPSRRNAITTFIAGNAATCTVPDAATLLKPGYTPPAVIAGNQLLDMLLGEQKGRVANHLGSRADVKAASAFILLSLAATLTIGALSQRLEHDRISATRLLRLVESNRPVTARPTTRPVTSPRGGRVAPSTLASRVMAPNASRGEPASAGVATAAPRSRVRSMALTALLLGSTAALGYLLYDMVGNAADEHVAAADASPTSPRQSAIVTEESRPSPRPSSETREDAARSTTTRATAPSPAKGATKVSATRILTAAAEAWGVTTTTDEPATTVRAPTAEAATRPEQTAPKQAAETPRQAPAPSVGPAAKQAVEPFPLARIAIETAAPGSALKSARQSGKSGETDPRPDGKPAVGVAERVEGQLIGYLEDSSPPDASKWFDLDGLSFKRGSADLSEGSEEQLNLMADILKAFPQVGLEVGGFTDNMGSPALNRHLSHERAKAVVSSLVKHGIPSSRLQASGYGSERPIADNTTASGRARHRRIAVSVTSK